MKIIALFFPALVSVVIRHKRMKKLEWNLLECAFEYALLVLINTFMTQAFIVYILKVETDVYSLESFPFFTKYVFFAFIFAFFIPYIEEVIKKYVEISFSVEKQEHREKL